MLSYETASLSKFISLGDNYETSSGNRLKAVLISDDG